MGPLTRKFAVLIALAAMVPLAACSTPPQPEQPTPPIVVQPPKTVFDSDPNQEWNIFPDPTTGEVGVYHKGDYVGSITGAETEDPPIPHKTATGERESQHQQPDSGEGGGASGW